MPARLRKTVESGLGASVRMIPTFLDLRTGKTAKGSDMPVFWWTEGNGACDCNRAIHFEGVAEEMNARQHIDKPELLAHQSLCYGCKRFVAIDVEGDLNSYDHEGKNPQPNTREQLLIAMNSEYGT
jgi:hypothetical protein